MEVTIKVQKATYDKKLVQLAVSSFNELFSKGLGPNDGDISWHWSYDAVVAYWDESIIGFIIFRHDEKAVGATLCHGYVLPDYRRRGVYSQLWNALIDELRKRGARRIFSGTHLNNAPTRAFWAKTGRREEFVTSEYEIPDSKPEPKPKP